MTSIISATTARDRLPVAVSFRPSGSFARSSNSRATRTTADPARSGSVRLASSRIASLPGKGSSCSTA